MDVCVLKLNGWPDTFDERINALSEAVDNLALIRPMPNHDTGWEPPANVTVYDLYPRRGSFVKPAFLKPAVFSLHVLQAVILLSILVLVRQRRPDVIHALDYALGGVAGTIISELFSIPLVVSVRGLKEPRYRSTMKEKGTLVAQVNYRILTVLSGWVLGHADHVVTKSAYQVEFVRGTLGIDTDFSTIPTGVDFDMFDPDTVDSKAISELLPAEEYSLPPDPTVILYLSKMIPEKGPDVLLELVEKTDQKLPEDVVFVFVGEFRNDEFETRIENLRRRIPDRVVMYPHRVPFDDVPKFIKTAEGMMLFSAPKHEGVPRILQESCAMQTPIIASSVTGIAGAFGDLPGCYLIARDDAEGFQSAVQEIEKNPPEMDRAVFREHFDIYQNYEKYANIYESVVEKSRKNGSSV